MSFEPPLHTKIKQEDDDTSAVINLDLDKSPADLVYEWNAKVRLKFKNYIIVDSEESLDSLMKWYIQTLKEEALDFEDYKSLKSLTANHIQFFKLYFDELNCCFVDNYLDKMEEILAFYMNLEVKCLPLNQSDGRKRAYKKQLSLLCRRVISMLHLYLLSREDRICHVIIKMKLSEEKKDFFNLLYGNFLTQEPKEKSDMEFCRAYVLYQKWKTILKPEEWGKMDEIMYKIHERTPECLKVNPVLKQILLPRSDSILDTLTHISQKHVTMAEEYFKYIKSNNNQEDNILDTSITSVAIQDNIPDLDDKEDQELEKAYEDYVKSMSTIHLDDDDCQVVGVSSVQNAHETDVIHEIVDDDIEIIYFKKKEEPQTVTRENKKSSTSTLSFLQSITIPASRDVSMETVSSSTNKVDKTKDMFEKSRNNTDVEVADSLTSVSLAKPIKNCRTNLTTSVAQTGFHSGEVVCLEDEPGITSDSNKETPMVITEEAIDIQTGSNSRTKSVVSIETQTDDWHMDYNQEKLSALEKHTEQNGICGSYYYYGLVTPPSDQPPDEPVPAVSESAPYSNVYTNFARTHSPDENDDEIDASPPNMTVEVNETLMSQNKPDKCTTDTEFIQEVESNEEKLHDRQNQLDEFEDTCPSPCGAISAMDRQQPGRSGHYELNNGLVENCLDDSPANNTTSISINTNGYCRPNVDYLDNDINSHAPLKNGQSIPITSTGIPCTSPDFLITSRDFPSDDTSFDSQNKLADISSTSADVTSTSTDAQDFNETTVHIQVDRQKDQSMYDLNTNVTEVEVSYMNNENYCTEMYGQSEDVTQSNLEDAEEEEISIEYHSLESNGEELLYIVDEALPISASVNICTEESSHSCVDDNDNGGDAEKERLNLVVPHRGLDINAEKIDVNSHENKRNGEVNPSRIMYTSVGKVIKSPIDDFSKFQEKLHMQWSQLKDTHDLDEIFSGSVSKTTKVCDNQDASFDLFNTKLSPIRKGPGSQVIINSTQNEVTSPAYERMDDFKSYYEQSKSTIEVPSTQNRTLEVEEEIDSVSVEKNIVHCAVDSTKIDSPEKLQDTTSRSTTNNLSDPDVSESQGTKRRTVKRVHITEIIMESNNSVPQLSTENTEYNLQGILRKVSPDERRKRSTWRIPKSTMNLKSLSQYNEEPNHSCIQGVPRVVLARLSDNEITQWLKVSELSRKVRLEKQQLQFASQQAIRVNYDKNLAPNSNGEVRSIPQSFGQWRQSTLHNKSKRLDEGRLISDINDNDCTAQQCTNSCCNNLVSGITNLNVSTNPPNTVLNLSAPHYNPFVFSRKRKHCETTASNNPPYHSDNAFIFQTETSKNTNKEGCNLGDSRKRKCYDVNLNSPLNSDNNIDLEVNLESFVNSNIDCQNMPNTKSDSNFSNFIASNVTIQQPAIVPEVEEYEKTIRLEEYNKSSIPSDLHNLNLRKFSPSPIIHCFSPQSDSLGHTFIPDSYSIENPSSVSARANDIEIQDNDTDIKPEEELDVVSLNVTDSYLTNVEKIDLDINKTQSESSDILPSNDVNSILICKESSLSFKKDSKSDALLKIDLNLPETESETRLPLKKRKLSVANTKEEVDDEDDYMGPDIVEEIIKRARAERIEKEDISYPAKPMISIAEIQEKLSEPHPRIFKTPAERKEMPPPPAPAYLNPTDTPRIVTEQYNNHTYNNPTINYHMNNVPYPFFPCASLSYFPPILLPLNSTTTFDVNLVNRQQQTAQQPSMVAQEPTRPKKERRGRGRKKNN